MTQGTGQVTSAACGRGAVSRVFVLSRDGGFSRAPEDWLRYGGPARALGAVAGAAQRPEYLMVFATLGRYGRRLLGRRDTQKGDGQDRSDHLTVVKGSEWW